MYIEQIYTDCLAQASYYIESNKEAVIIDPIRDHSLYLDLLKKRDSKLKYIFETHFHADFVSGHVELAQITNAKIVFGPNAKTGYLSIEAHDQQEFFCGDIKFRVLHTPGHTMESVCYLLLSKDNSEEAVFTGDTLFIGEVGRPDLAVNPTLTSADLAVKLYHSLQNVLMKLPDDVIVYPGHGAGSACGKNIGLEKQSTIGLQKQFNYALQPMSENSFVELVTKEIPKAPDYFAHDVNMNKNGYSNSSIIFSKSLNKMSSDELIENQNKGAIILDVRLPNEFETGFIPGAINIGKAGMFAPWVATMIPLTIDMIIICHDGDEKEVISRLARVGFENIIGYSTITEWENAGHGMHTIHSITSDQIVSHIENSFKILDVRKKGELDLGFLTESIHIPLDTLHTNMKEIKKTDKFLIYCAGGYRSMIAASILQSRGYKHIKNIYGGFNTISKNQDLSDYIKIS